MQHWCVVGLASGEDYSLPLHRRWVLFSCGGTFQSYYLILQPHCAWELRKRRFANSLFFTIFFVLLALPCLSVFSCNLFTLAASHQSSVVSSGFFSVMAQPNICDHKVAKLASSSPACPCTAPLAELGQCFQNLRTPSRTL